jgi:hypothetical protein
MQTYFSSEQELSSMSNSWKAPRIPSTAGDQTSARGPLAARWLLRQCELNLDEGFGSEEVDCGG